MPVRSNEGRIARALAQLFGVKGDYPNLLDEVIVPVVTVADLSPAATPPPTPPQDQPAIPVVGTATTATGANQPIVRIVPGGLGAAGFAAMLIRSIQISPIGSGTATNTVLNIGVPDDPADFPVLTGIVSQDMRTAQDPGGTPYPATIARGRIDLSTEGSKIQTLARFNTGVETLDEVFEWIPPSGFFLGTQPVGTLFVWGTATGSSNQLTVNVHADLLRETP